MMNFSEEEKEDFENLPQLDYHSLIWGIDFPANVWYIYTRVKGTHGVKNKQGT